MPINDLFLEDFPKLAEVPKPTWKHRYFYNFLEISPSYYQIYLYKKKEISLQKIKQIEQYEKVLETYDLVGNIYNLSFEDWWKNGAYKLFEPAQNYQILFKINLKKSISYNQEIMKRVYLNHQKDLKFYPGTINFVNNKIQEIALGNRLNLIEDKIDRYGMMELWFKNRKMPNWFYGYLRKDEIFGRTNGASFQRIKPALKFEVSQMAYVPDRITPKIKAQMGEKKWLERPFFRVIDSKKTSSKSANKAKRYISMLVSKHQREALILSENAARGIFPSKQMFLKKYTDFDFDTLKNAPEFKKHYDLSTLKLGDLYATGSNSKTKRKLYEDRQNDMETAHRMLEQLDTELKGIIDQKAIDLYKQKYRQLLKQLRKNPPIPQRFGS